MRLANDDDKECSACPHCDKDVAGYEDDVSDGDYRNDEEDIASVPCPACGKSIAVIRTHYYQLGKFKDAAKGRDA